MVATGAAGGDSYRDVCRADSHVERDQDQVVANIIELQVYKARPKAFMMHVK